MILTAFYMKFHETKHEIPPKACRRSKKAKENNVQEVDPLKIETKDNVEQVDPTTLEQKQCRKSEPPTNRKNTMCNK